MIYNNFKAFIDKTNGSAKSTKDKHEYAHEYI